MPVLQQSHRISRDLNNRTDQPASLDLDDIQHFLMSRPPARAARYEFLAFKRGSDGRTWLTGLIDKVGTASAVGANVLDARWVTVGFTWNGLQTLGVDEASLATFPEEFRQGMAARAGVLGTTGANHPDHWVGELARPNLHAIVILFARDIAERERCRGEHERHVAQCGGVEVLSTLDLEAIPPFDYAHEHFGYRDRLSQPVIEGTGVEPTSGSGPPIKPGEFFIGYPDEEGPPPDCRSRKFFPERQLCCLFENGRARRRVSRFPPRPWQNTGPAGTNGCQADGTMAERRSACSDAIRMVPNSVLILIAATILTTQRWTLTAMAARSGHISGA